MALVSLDKVSLSLSDRPILDRVDLSIGPTERWALVGRSRAGKTSLLNLLHGDLEPDEGRLVSERKVRVGYMRQVPESPEGATVYSWALSGRSEVVDLKRKIERLRDDAESGDPRLLANLAELEENYDRQGGPDLERRAAQTLEAVGFPASSYDLSCDLLSGGERSRLDLARILIMDPDLLLLDEPTLHLDIQGIEFLEQYLSAFEGAAVVATHDRTFMDTFATGLLELDGQGRLVAHPGEGSQALDGAEAQSGAAGALPYLEVEHSGKVVFFVKQVTLRPGDQVLLQDVSFMVGRGERLAVIGPAGCGKSTLLRALAGKDRPERGQMGSGFNALLGVFDPALASLTSGRSVLDEIKAVRPELDPDMRRQVAARFLFEGEAAERLVESLSAGEQSRLALALLILGPHNVLLLDEPTRLLDLPSREVIEQALADYPGTLVVVSQDRAFLDRVAQRVLSFEGRELLDEAGSYSDLRQQGQIMRDVPRAPKIKGGRKKKASGAADGGADRASLEARVAELRKAIETLQQRMADPAMALDWEGLENLSAEKKEREAELATVQVELDRLPKT